jgi:hypothetical protein
MRHSVSIRLRSQCVPPRPSFVVLRWNQSAAMASDCIDPTFGEVLPVDVAELDEG